LGALKGLSAYHTHLPPSTIPDHFFIIFLDNGNRGLAFT
jgi:hypothetical protein